MIDDLKPYPKMMESGVPWFGQMPSHWQIQRGKSLFGQTQLDVREDDEIVTCFRDGQVTLRTNRRAKGFMVALKEVGYQGVRKGQLVIHAMDAFAGAVGISDSDGKCSPEYIVCNARDANIIPDYFARALRLAAHQRYIEVACSAVRERAPRLRFPNFGEMLLPLPPLREQMAIVKYLAHLDGKINRYIGAKNKLIKALAEERETVTHDALRLASTRSLRLDVAADVVDRPINRRDEEVYTPIGLFNRGRGIFHKEPTKGAMLGDSTFYWIEEGDLVLSGQFAWEGAIAMAGQEDSGCVASHRYPVLRGKTNVLESAYLLSFFKTGLGHLLLDQHSRGAAGRNRPLNARTLMKEKIPIPPLPVQQRITSIVHLETRLCRTVAKTAELLLEYRTRLIADVVTGNLDVRETAARLPEEAQQVEPLDEIDDMPQDESAADDEELEAADAA
jgi:type I restriction enzyme S subunit